MLTRRRLIVAAGVADGVAAAAMLLRRRNDPVADERKRDLLARLARLGPLPDDDAITQEQLSEFFDIACAIDSDSTPPDPDYIRPVLSTFGYGDGFAGYAHGARALLKQDRDAVDPTSRSTSALLIPILSVGMTRAACRGSGPLSPRSSGGGGGILLVRGGSDGGGTTCAGRGSRTQVNNNHAANATARAPSTAVGWHRMERGVLMADPVKRQRVGGRLARPRGEPSAGQAELGTVDQDPEDVGQRLAPVGGRAANRFGPWVVGIARLVVREARRRAINESLPAALPDPRPSAGADIDDGDEVAHLLARLPEDERQAVRFFFLAGRDAAETARLLDRSRSGTYALVRAAVGTLARWMGADRGSRADASAENQWHDGGSGCDDGVAESVRDGGLVWLPPSSRPDLVYSTGWEEGALRLHRRDRLHGGRRRLSNWCGLRGPGRAFVGGTHDVGR